MGFLAAPKDVSMRSVHALANFWQWVSSDKLRVNAMERTEINFVNGIEEFRLAYEVTTQTEAERITSPDDRV
ncbi:hypothetical protein [Lichenicoccus sp.]|uniref:hypothetical protein n=1 Tax=Lichenicoccus sp. TaxID=2781899 RepID=UPI003D0B7ACC